MKPLTNPERARRCVSLRYLKFLYKQRRRDRPGLMTAGLHSDTKPRHLQHTGLGGLDGDLCDKNTKPDNCLSLAFESV